MIEIKEDSIILTDDDNKFDLARILIGMFGPAYAPHERNGLKGRLATLMDMNHITAQDYMLGQGEADAFENGNFVGLHQSTLRKVDVIANIAQRTYDGTLKTKATWWEKNGVGLRAAIETLKDHPIYALIGFLITMSGIAISVYATWFKPPLT